MHVLQIGKFYPPEYVGGLESVVVTLNAELVRRGATVTCIVSALRGRGRAGRVDGVDVRRLGSLGTVLSQPLAPGLLAAVRRAPGDVVHLHHPNPLADVAAILDRARPLIITQHSDVVRQRPLVPLYLPVVRRALARARFIVVGSEQLGRLSRELRGFEAKVRVIPFGIDGNRFALTPDVEARAHALRASWPEGPAVLTVGRMVPYKGHDVLLRAMADVDATVVLIGTGPLESRLRARAGVRAVFAGRVSDADLVAHYHASDVFCLPSVTVAEAFGITLLEAMACGKPLVTTALPTGVSAVNRHEVTGVLVPPGDPGALRDALRRLLGDDARRAAMGRAARDVFEREYTAALMGERYLSLYREALA